MANISPYPQDWKEARRQRAFELSQQGWAQFRIAEALGVSRPAVSQWSAAVREDGPAALRARPHTGAPPKLTAAQRCRIPEFLSHGAEAYGFRGEILTCARIGKIIEWEFGVSYSKSHVSRLMKEVDWTPQKPIERATQRDEVQIEEWRTEIWPELKKKPAESGASSFLLTNRASTCCPLWSRRTRRVARRPF
jgi:transposase